MLSLFITFIFKNWVCQAGTRLSNFFIIGNGLGKVRGTRWRDEFIEASWSMKMQTKRMIRRSKGMKIVWEAKSSLKTSLYSGFDMSAKSLFKLAMALVLAAMKSDVV